MMVARVLIIAALIAVVALVSYFVYEDSGFAPPDGHTTFQVRSVASQGDLHYVATTDGRVLRFDRQKVEWVAVQVGCEYSADEWTHVDSVPVIVNVKLLGCVG